MDIEIGGITPYQNRKYIKKKMLPFVSVQVRQWGAWKLHPSNFTAENCFTTKLDQLHKNLEAHGHMDNSHTKTYLTSCTTMLRRTSLPWHTLHYNKNIILYNYPFHFHIFSPWTTCPVQNFLFPFNFFSFLFILPYLTFQHLTPGLSIPIIYPKVLI